MIDPDDTALLSYLQQHGATTSAQIQQAIKKSQATVSRLIATMPDRVIALGRGRSARYAVCQGIGEAAASQPIWLIDDAGQAQRIATLSLLARGQVHVQADKVDTLHESGLPWYLSPLRAQGFLGRLLAQRLSMQGLTPDPEAWDTRSVLIAAMQLHDAPGAIVIGHDNAHAHPVGATLPSGKAALKSALDALASDVARTLPAGSSAGGEQPKFLAQMDDGHHLLVKFSPPHGTPFGERWSDLLLAEHLCSEVLARHGHAASKCQLLRSATRSYLLSERFDRVGGKGRRHVVALGAVHAAFVPGSYSGWAASCEALARQGRLSERDAEEAGFRLQFGRLIGNTDMHSGNLGLFAQGASLRELAKGRFAIAPSYDMLPMRWRPDTATGALHYDPFDTGEIRASPMARVAAQDFWAALARHSDASPPLRGVASEMATRMGV